GNGTPPVVMSIFNNLLIGNGVGIALSAPVATFGNNALYNNVNNYDGVATDGAGYVKTDPLLDTSTTPPGLLSGSPGLGAGDSTKGSPHDFWGRRRGSKVDIGAVQSSSCVGPTCGKPVNEVTFPFVGGPQNFIVPPGVTQVTITAAGAQGGNVGCVGGAGGIT